MDDPDMIVQIQVAHYGHNKFKEGAEEVIAIIETQILGWLSQLPDTKRQKEQRHWIKKKILEYKHWKNWITKEEMLEEYESFNAQEESWAKCNHQSTTDK